MIILQILAFLLLIPLSILVLIIFNIFIYDWNFLAFIVFIGLIYSGFCGLLFLSTKVMLWVFAILAVLYIGRMKYLARKLNAKKESENHHETNRKEYKMSEEKKLILEMLKEGKITVDEAEKLLEAQNVVEEKSSTVKSANKKFLRVFVNEGDKTKVNINIPIALAEVGLKFIPKDKLNIAGNPIDLEQIINMIKEGNDGEFVNVQTTDQGKDVKVKIYVE